MSFICDHFIQLTHPLFCPFPTYHQLLKPWHYVLLMFHQKGHPYFTNLFSENHLHCMAPTEAKTWNMYKWTVNILSLTVISVFVVADPLCNKISWKLLSASTMSNSSSFIFSGVHFSQVFTITIHWNCFCKNKQWLLITK